MTNILSGNKNVKVLPNLALLLLIHRRIECPIGRGTGNSCRCELGLCFVACRTFGGTIVASSWTQYTSCSLGRTVVSVEGTLRHELYNALCARIPVYASLIFGCLNNSSPFRSLSIFFSLPEHIDRLQLPQRDVVHCCWLGEPFSSSVISG